MQVSEGANAGFACSEWMVLLVAQKVWSHKVPDSKPEIRKGETRESAGSRDGGWADLGRQARGQAALALLKTRGRVTRPLWSSLVGLRHLTRAENGRAPKLEVHEWGGLVEGPSASPKPHSAHTGVHRPDLCSLNPAGFTGPVH